MRNDALPRIKQACENLGSVKKNMALRWTALCKAKHITPSTAPPEMARYVEAFNDAFAKAKGGLNK